MKKLRDEINDIIVTTVGPFTGEGTDAATDKIMALLKARGDDDIYWCADHRSVSLGGPYAHACHYAYAQEARGGGLEPNPCRMTPAVVLPFDT